jgi:hypothetical protein
MAKEPKLKAPKVLTLNADLISDEQKKALRAKALEHVTKKRVEKAEDEYFQQAIHEAELVDKPEEQLEYILLDMAGHAPYIMLDGVQFFHGQTYEVTRSVANTMREIVARGWKHEDEIGGANRDLYRRPRNTTMSMKTGMVRSGPIDPASGGNVQAVSA